ncbi:hypothetical protein D3C73_1618360 [compost metagenome]
MHIIVGEGGSLKLDGFIGVGRIPCLRHAFEILLMQLIEGPELQLRLGSRLARYRCCSR